MVLYKRLQKCNLILDTGTYQCWHRIHDRVPISFSRRYAPNVVHYPSQTLKGISPYNHLIEINKDNFHLSYTINHVFLIHIILLQFQMASASLFLGLSESKYMKHSRTRSLKNGKGDSRIGSAG